MFLAEEFDAQVFATDLWIPATENYNRFRERGLDSCIVPLVKKGGFIAVATPGLQKDFPGGVVPEEMAPYWQEDMNFYSGEWWKELWLKEASIDLKHCRSLRCHEQAWIDWLQCDNPYAIGDIDMMKAEGGKYFDTIGLVAEVK